MVLSECLDLLSKARVLCIGDIMLDAYVYGHVKRLSPEAPVPVLWREREEVILGGVGNVVRNLDALHVRFGLVAVSGDDDRHLQLQTHLAQLSHGTCHLFKDPSRSTSLKTRYVCEGTQMLRVDDESTHLLSDKMESDLLQAWTHMLSDYDIVLCSDYGKGALTPDVVQSIISLSRAQNKKVFIDPKGSDYRAYEGAHFITPNLKELKNVIPVEDDTPSSILDAAHKLRTHHRFETVLVTCGAQGMVVASSDHAYHIPAHARDIFDVSGAGDTVIALLSSLIAGGASLTEAVTLANMGAGVVVGKKGTAVVSREEIAQEAKRLAQAPLTKIMTLDSLQIITERWRTQCLSVGFTNGCFDLLHAGHVALLQEARRMCDRLIVGLNTDSSVQGLKGIQRPIYSEAERAHIVASLECVDAVVLFSDETPLKLIQTLQPHVLMKGGDYTPTTIVGAADVIAWGGHVHVIPLKPGYSTTNTIQKIQAEPSKK